ncbi:MAG: phosphatidate cytidylyltransferase [Hyphomonadaceae bacterium]|nr:phosphatidate cytidylyltransferase [Hyphomonadaceae bacterium]
MTARAPHFWADLAVRAASAAVLIPFGVGAAVLGGPWLAAACGAASVAMAFEWARMSEPTAIDRAFAFTLAGALGAILFAAAGALREGLVWLALAALASGLRRRTLVGFIEAAGGAVYIGAPCAVFMTLRGLAPEGLAVILFLFAVIWSADSAAYLGGSVLKGPRVHAALSPQKTWSGLICGTLAGAAGGTAFALWSGAGPAWAWAAAGAALAVVGLAGDLFESLLKRRFGVKDASGLIPGHGGVLDRIDGLMLATLALGAALALAPGLIAAFPDIGG